MTCWLKDLNLPNLVTKVGIPLGEEDLQGIAEIMELDSGHDKLARMPRDVLEEIFSNYLQKRVHARFVGGMMIFVIEKCPLYPNNGVTLE